MIDSVKQVSRDFRGHQIAQVKGSAAKLEVSRSFGHRDHWLCPPGFVCRGDMARL